MRYLLLVSAPFFFLACGTSLPAVETPVQNVSTQPAPPRDDCPTDHGFVPDTKDGKTACRRAALPLAPDAETWRCPDTGYLFWVPAGKGDKSQAAPAKIRCASCCDDTPEDDACRCRGHGLHVTF